MDHEHRRQWQPRSSRDNAPGSGSASGGASSGKHKGGGGGKKPIKVVYISNPMRVKTSAAGFRALVQELTGRHADPSKYSPEDPGGSPATAAADLDCAAAQGLSTRAGGAGAGASSETVVAAASTSSAAADHPPDAVPEDDGFGSQLLENNYAVFSPPTLLYDYDQHPHSKFPFS